MSTRHRPYPGDSDTKRIARALIFLKVQRMWEATGRPKGKFITLTGHGDDIGIFRDFFEAPPQHTIFVDNLVHRGIHRVRQEWKGAKTWFGNVKNVLDAMREEEVPVALIYLDFMGHYTEKVAEVLESLKDLVVENGIVVYTFLRGHENDIFNPHWHILKEKTRQRMRRYHEEFPETRSEKWDSIRFWGYEELLRDELGGSHELIYSIRYTRANREKGGKALGTLALQNVRLKSSTWLRALQDDVFEEDKTGRVETLAATQRLRDLVDQLSMMGYSGKQISGLLNLATRSVAAYRAAFTKRQVTATW